jgi:hypothetical protein
MNTKSAFSAPVQTSVFPSLNDQVARLGSVHDRPANVSSAHPLTIRSDSLTGELAGNPDLDQLAACPTTAVEVETDAPGRSQP